MNMKKTLTATLAVALLCSAASTAASALEPHGTGIKMRDWLINNPNYSFSDAYKETVWYDNFTDLTLTENHRNNVLRIAVSQLGYHEGVADSGDFSGMDQSARGNCVEYARLLINRQGANYNNNSYEWCACFVNWCLNQAHIDYADSEIGCWKWVQILKDKSMFQNSVAYKGTYTPQPADMIFFNWSGNNTHAGHIGLVLYTTETTVYTIEGNSTDNNVGIRSYALDDPRVIGYGTPPYVEGNEPTLDFSCKDGMPRGEYVVNSSTTYLMESPGKGRVCRVPLGSSVSLKTVDGKFAQVEYGDEVGYLYTRDLVLFQENKGEDTLTYDANGGAGAPDSVKIAYCTKGEIAESAPTLDGDTFLGWASQPYYAKPDYRPGDRITLSGNVTLYAVWEKRSAKLAEDAIAEGKITSLYRPSSIINASALIMGAIDPAKLTPVGISRVTAKDDPEAGKVLSVSSTAAGLDPYITIPYASIMKELRYEGVSADDVNYVILRVRNLSATNTDMDLFFTCTGQASEDDSDKTVTSARASLAAGNGWHYVVFDMTDANGWSGQITSLRLDWTSRTDAAGESVLIADLFLAANEAERDALTSGLYIYPAQEQSPPETQPETAAPTSPEEDGTTDSPTDSESNSESRSESDTSPNAADKGCFSSVASSIAVMGSALLGAIPLLFKHRREE